MFKSMEDLLLKIKEYIFGSPKVTANPSSKNINKSQKSRVITKPPVKQAVQSTLTKKASPLVTRKTITVKSKTAPKPLPTNLETQPPWIKIGPDARVAVDTSNNPIYEALKYSEQESGKRTQIITHSTEDAFEIVIGVDFGTSSTKIVMGDRALEKAYAVPFMKTVDVNQYLLPSRLYETDNKFSILKGKKVHRDLKLALIADVHNESRQVEVIAFLALLVRHARSWFYEAHAEIYGHSKLIWSLVIGLPVAHQFSGDIPTKFKEIGEIAWLVSNNNSDISRANILNQLAQFNIVKTIKMALTDDDALVQVIPEISAQIYGFVKSTSFNPKVSNIYMMVDVGAGTLDSSLFQVRQSKVSDKFDFEFFTSVVEAHGVMNLHRSRINWWRDALQSIKDQSYPLIEQALDAAMFPTDQSFSIPNSYTEYITNTLINSIAVPSSPDKGFYKKLTLQIQSHTFYRTWEGYNNRGFLSKEQLTGTPVFFCGGGMRLPYYQDLLKTLESFDGCPWLTATSRKIQKPKILEAPGVSENDFDRLSVAFGLSFLDVGDIIKSIPEPRVVNPPESSYSNYYIDKDSV